MSYCIKCDRCGEVSYENRFEGGRFVYVLEAREELYGNTRLEPKHLCKWCAKALGEFFGG